MVVRKWIALGLLALMLVATGAAAQGTAWFSAVMDGDIVVYDSAGNGTLYDLPFSYIGQQVWNAAGDKIAVIGSVEGFFELWLIDLAAGNSYQVSGGIEPFPPLFNSTGDLLFVLPPEAPDFSGNTPYTVRLMLITPQQGAQPAQIGSFIWQVGCGGGSPFPADAVYGLEAGFMGNQLALIETPYGYLYSNSCAGIGYGLLNPVTGEDLTIPGSEDMFRAAISPDGTQLYAVYLNTNDAQRAFPILVRVDLSTLTMTQIPTSAQPDQIAVGVDGAVFYSSRVESGDLLEGLTAEERTRVIDSIGLSADYPIPSYTVSIHRVDPVTNAESLVYQGEGFAVGRMAAVDADTLMFSVIANQDAFVTALAQGNPFTGVIPVSVYTAETSGAGAVLVGQDVRQFAAP